jgi:cytoskeleton protein RodZ
MMDSPTQGTIGTRLRQAREAKAASVQDAANALHLPANVIEALEAERFQQLGAVIYARGHLRAYLRWLQLPEVLVDSAMQKVDHAPPALKTATHVPHLRYLADRYAMRAVYVLLTLSIIVPALWVATEHAQRNAERDTARSLDIAPADGLSHSQQPLRLPAADQPTGADTPVGPPTLLASEEEQQTVVASLTPFYSLDNRPLPAPSAVPAVAEDPPEAPLAADALAFRFVESSWVEILDREGRRLEYGIVPAGSERRYPSDRVARVALGNARAVELRRGGSLLDFEPYRRANVARFAVSSAGELRPLGD